MNSFYSRTELENIGFFKFGENVLVSRKSSIYNADKISIGNNVRIDDFCILSGKITIGDYIHIAAFSALYGDDEGIIVKDFANISSKVTIYAISDDYSGKSMTNPMITEEFKKLVKEKVIIGRHVILGSGCVVLPGVLLKEGSAFGAISLINRDSEEWTINVGIPFKKIKNRSKDLLEYEKYI